MTSLIKRRLPARMQFFASDDLEESTFLLYMWILELLPTKDFGAHIREYATRTGSTLAYTADVRETFSAARDGLFMHFDIVRLKTATFKALALRLTQQSDLEAHFAREGLPRDCADLYIWLIKDEFFWSVMRERLKLFRDPVLFQDLEMEPDRLVAQCYEDFNRYHVYRNIKFLVQKKLRFVANSNNTTLDEFEQDIKARAVAYYYKVRPFRHRLHATNYAKSSVDGRVNQIIQFHKREENARLRDENGAWNNPGNGLVVAFDDTVHYATQYGELFA